jgi:hypothetical protein
MKSWALHVLTDTGEGLFLPLERIKTARGGNPGRYRFDVPRMAPVRRFSPTFSAAPSRGLVGAPLRRVAVGLVRGHQLREPRSGHLGEDGLTVAAIG